MSLMNFWSPNYRSFFCR